jgi:hypothetical protein
VSRSTLRGGLRLALGLLLLAPATALAQQPFWESHGGTITLKFDRAALRAVGLEAPASDPTFTIQDELGSGLHFASTTWRLQQLFRGTLRARGETTLGRVGGGAAVRLGDPVLVLAVRNDGAFNGCAGDRLVTDLVAFELAHADARSVAVVNAGALRFAWDDLELKIAADWARRIGLPGAAGARVGKLSIAAPITPGTSFYALGVGGDDCGCTVDPGDTAASAYSLPAPGQAADDIGHAGDVDAFAIDLVSGVRYTLRTEQLGDDMDTVITLRATDGTTLIAEDDDGAEEDRASRLDHVATRTGRHFLFVRHYSADATKGTYRLVVETTGAPAPTPGPLPGGDDHGDAPASATRLTVGQQVAGAMQRANDLDWFSVELAANTTYVMRTGGLQDDMDTVLTLFAANGTTQVAENDDADQGGGYESSLEHRATAAGRVYLRVKHFGDAARGRYTLLVEAQTAPTPPGPITPLPSSAFTHVRATPATGPDVIVGDLQDLARYGRANGITAFAVGTTSCNAGDRELNWYSDTAEHPVIGSSLYRIKDGRLEQVAMSWLKHGYFAMSENLCFNDCRPVQAGDRLGVHCSDPYTAGLNGEQSNLGPRGEVNGATGVFPYPYTEFTVDSTTGKRLQVADADLDPARNAGALYFVEGRYVARDDHAAGNALNNASTRRVRVTGSGTTWDLEFVVGDGMRRQKPAIEVWRDLDQDVTLEGVSVAGDGHFDVACKVTRNADGTWHYEYVVFNMSSHRSARGFSVPLPAGARVTNVGFHDVAHHSGEAFKTTDWASSTTGGAVSWTTSTYAQDRDANALRWGTTYNFRFDCDRAPATTAGRATLALFRPGSAPDPTVPVKVPGAGAATDTTAPVFAGATRAQARGNDALEVGWAAATDDTTAASALTYLVYVAERAAGQDFTATPAATVRGVTQAVVSGLRAGVEYFVVVRARDAAGNVDRNAVERRARTTAAQDLQPPAFAGAALARATSEEAVEVEWVAAGDDVSPPSAIRYRVFAATASGGQDLGTATVETSPGALRATLRGLSPGTRYWFVVRAVDQAGREDGNRFEVEAETYDVLAAPTVEVTLRNPSATAATGPTLRLGATGADVRRLQDALRRHGFFSGTTDGAFGSATDTAVRRFQTARGLSSDGVVGANTWAALAAVRAGEQVRCVASLRNASGQTLRLTGYAVIQTPDGTMSRVGNTRTVDVGPAATVDHAVTVDVGAGAAPGRYTLTIVFRSATGTLDLDSTTFTVAPGVSP